MERTLLIIKPDGVERRLVGGVIRRMEAKGLKLVALQMMTLSEERAGDLYSVHKGKPFFEKLIRFITRGPIVGVVLEGPECISVVRNLMGAANYLEALPGTIRGDFSTNITENIVHGSDSRENAEQEISVIFPDLNYTLPECQEEANSSTVSFS
jgi:nucleoside-diphosphate kinase